MRNGSALLLGSSLVIGAVLSAACSAVERKEDVPPAEPGMSTEEPRSIATGVVNGETSADGGSTPPKDPVADRARALVNQGRTIFRFDSFGSERFFGDQLGLHAAIAGEALGGVGPGLPPKAALGLGLKVDVEALDVATVEAIRNGIADLEAPATTVALLKAGAVIGVKAVLDGQKNIVSAGITCALCHSQVDNSLAPGIGHRLDTWPNRDLDVGRIVAFAPSLKPYADLLGVDEATVRRVLESWGPGKYDAHLNLDGRAFRPDGKSGATLIPAAFGLGGVNLHTYTGMGSVPYWNAFVANTQMNGLGTFFDPRLDDARKFPVAARARLSNVRNVPDLVTSKLAALQFYQLAVATPRPPSDSFDTVAAHRGRDVFDNKGRCATCHVPPLYTEPGWAMHTGAEIGIDDFQASRSPDGRYRTTPLKGLFTRMRGGFYHDGRFTTLDDVVRHYDRHMRLGLTPREHTDLVQYLKSL